MMCAHLGVVHPVSERLFHLTSFPHIHYMGEKAPVQLPSAILPSGQRIGSYRLLQAWHRPDFLPSSEERSATTYPGRMAERSPTSFSDLLASESGLLSSSYSSNGVLDSHSERSPAESAANVGFARAGSMNLP